MYYRLRTAPIEVDFSDFTLNEQFLPEMRANQRNSYLYLPLIYQDAKQKLSLDWILVIIGINFILCNGLHLENFVLQTKILSWI